MHAQAQHRSKKKKIKRSEAKQKPTKQQKHTQVFSRIAFDLNGNSHYAKQVVECDRVALKEANGKNDAASGEKKSGAADDRDKCGSGSGCVCM
jgi:hypothetical protein